MMCHNCISLEKSVRRPDQEGLTEDLSKVEGSYAK